MKNVTQKDIAKALNLSQPTVGLVVGRNSSGPGKKKLKQETIDRILQKAREMGYSADRHAQIMRQGKTRQIGLIFGGGILEVANERIYCVAQAFKRLGYDLLTMDCRWCNGDLGEALDYMMASRVDGILLTTTYETAAELNSLVEREIPIVALSASYMPGIPLVRSDMRGGVRQTVEHFLSQGRRRFVQLSFHIDSKIPLKKWRWQQGLQAMGLRDAMSAVDGTHEISEIEDYPAWLNRTANAPGVSGITICITSDIKKGASSFNPFHYGKEFAKALLSDASQRPDAVLCPNDDWAFGFVNEALRAGVPILDDMDVAGFNDSSLCDAFFLPITTVRQPTQAMSEKAVSLLIDKIEGRGAKARIYDMPCELVVHSAAHLPVGAKKVLPSRWNG